MNKWTAEYEKQWKKKWYLKNRIKILNLCKKYYLKNRKKILRRVKKYVEKNTIKVARYKKQYAKKNNKRISKYKKFYMKMRYKNEVEFRLCSRFRSYLYLHLKNSKKSDHALELLGCSIRFLKTYLEKQFKPGMSWDNYGKWHIDHVKPCAKFDLSKTEEQKKCFHYTNLQPLWAKENLSKGATYK
jgi:hypothetical protein